MRRGSLLLALALLGGVCIGCEELADETTADFSFVSTKRVLRLSGGTPAVEITIENTGDRAGYNVSCDVNALKGNTIIDGASAYFADLNDIPPGQRAVDDAIFWGMGSHTDYDRLCSAAPVAGRGALARVCRYLLSEHGRGTGRV